MISCGQESSVSSPSGFLQAFCGDRDKFLHPFMAVPAASPAHWAGCVFFLHLLTFFLSCSAGDETQGLIHARQELYYQATFPAYFLCLCASPCLSLLAITIESQETEGKIILSARDWHAEKITMPSPTLKSFVSTLGKP